MPAATTREVRDFKTHFRRATLGILQSAGATPVVLERARALLKSSARLEVSFDLGQALNRDTLPSGRHVYDFFAATLKVRVVTGRGEDQTNPADPAVDLHEQLTSLTLDALAEDQEPFTLENLPYYAVQFIEPAGTTSDFDPIYFEDFTDIRFSLRFGIRSTAWPSAFFNAV